MDDTPLVSELQDDQTNDLALLSCRMSCGWRELSRVLCVAWLTCLLTGCSLGVMAGKMIFGDPKVPSAFERATHVKLEKGEKKVVVLCSTPHAVSSEISSLNFDILDGVTRRLKYQGVKVVNPDQVMTWLDDHGGAVNFTDPTALAEEFEADYVIYIEIEQFSYWEENSRDLFRGNVLGQVSAYELKDYDGIKHADEVFSREYTNTYPKNYPVSAQTQSSKVFLKKYIDILTSDLARSFYAFRESDTVE